MVRPDDKRQKGNRSGRINHRGITKQRLARKGRNNLRYHTKCRQDNDVHLGVPKEPEDMLEEYGVTATRGAEEAGAEVDIHQHHGHGAS